MHLFPEFHYNIVQVVYGSTRFLPRRLSSGTADYFDNVMTKFMINNKTDAWKTDVNLFSRKQYLFLVTLLKIAIFQEDSALNKVLQTRFLRFLRFQNRYKFVKSTANPSKRATVHRVLLNYEIDRFIGSLAVFVNRTYFRNHSSWKLSDIGFLSEKSRQVCTVSTWRKTRETSCCGEKEVCWPI